MPRLTRTTRERKAKKRQRKGAMRWSVGPGKARSKLERQGIRNCNKAETELQRKALEEKVKTQMVAVLIRRPRDSGDMLTAPQECEDLAAV